MRKVLQILHFAVVAGFQLCFFTNFFGIYILINYLKVLICILYYLISFSVMKIGKFDILNFLEFFFFLQSQFFCILTSKVVPT